MGGHLSSDRIQTLGISSRENRPKHPKLFCKRNTSDRDRYPVLTKKTGPLPGSTLKNGDRAALDWHNIPVKKTGTRIIRLGDLATAKYREQEPSSYFRINGLNTINMVIYPEDDVNNLEVAKSVKETIAELQPALPAGYSLLLASDSTEYIRGELDKVFIGRFSRWASCFVCPSDQPATEIPAADSRSASE
jgi:multidrug efflux pump subunit AcrB